MAKRKPFGADWDATSVGNPADDIHGEQGGDGEREDESAAPPVEDAPQAPPVPVDSLNAHNIMATLEMQNRHVFTNRLKHRSRVDPEIRFLVDLLAKHGVEL